MPWDGTELFVADLDGAGRPGAPVRVAGGDDESVFQPSWSPDGQLYFVSDRTGWWNLYRLHGDVVQGLHPLDAEFGKPQWTLGSTTYAFASERRVVVTYAQNGRWQMALLSLEPRRVEPLAPRPRAARRGRGQRPRRLFRRRLADRGPGHRARVPGRRARPRSLKRSRTDTARRRRWSRRRKPSPSTAPARPVHAFYYPPANPGFRAPAGTAPPLLVLSHGGPTGATDAVFDPEVQFWTTRGFAVVDVNYGGSSGYGRAYRRAAERAVGHRRRARRRQRRQAPGGAAARPIRPA